MDPRIFDGIQGFGRDLRIWRRDRRIEG